MAEQVSGVGRNSKRTDLNPSQQPVRYMSGGTYGEGQELMGLQQGASMMGQTPQAPQPSMGAMQALASARPVVPLTAVTQRPNEPLTAGVDFGAGPGSDVLNLPRPQQRTLKSVVEELIPFDETGEISAIYNFLLDRGN
jgi:hypothetical protein